MNEPEISEDLIAAHGLKPDEYAKILEIIGRSPTFTELGIFSAMWNEHCSYKSSKKWLRTLPTSGPQVICGPGENAGVVDIGDGQAVVFKMESHNHPSYIEPYQGAATGVGGILRDVFTMGARPIAAMNSLSFGAPDHPKTKQLVHGVVEGVGGYGNCFGCQRLAARSDLIPPIMAIVWSMPLLLVWRMRIRFFIRQLPALACRWFTWAPKPDGTGLAAQPWRQLNLTTASKKKGQRFKWVIPLLKSGLWKPVLS